MFLVLYVCTGNICRSPMAERLFGSMIDADADAAAGSAGMRAVVGSGIDGPSAESLLELGVDPTRHRARQFSESMARSADLILTATRAHRDEVLGIVPTALRRTFTIKEFSRIACMLMPTGDPREMVEAAALNRGQPSDLDDIADPFGFTASRAKSIADELSASTKVAVTALGFNMRLVTGPPPTPSAQ